VALGEDVPVAVRCCASTRTVGLMTIEHTYYCDDPDCENHSKHAHYLIRLTEMQLTKQLHFCSWDCVLRFGAQFAPSERVEA
jgi:hypothetical protein